MATIPNQNNINDIIKSQINSINSTIKIIVDAASSKLIKRSAAEIQNLKQYQMVINTVFNKGGLFENLMSAINMVGNTNSKSNINTHSLKANIRKISGLTDAILAMDIDTKKIEKSIDTLKSMNNIYGELPKLIDTINKINVPLGIVIKIHLIKRVLKKVAKLRRTLNVLNFMSPLMVTGLLSLSIIQTYALKLAETFESLNSIEINLSLLVKLLIIPKIIRLLRKVVNEAIRITTSLGAVRSIKSIYIISWIFSALADIFKSFKAISISIFYKSKFKKIEYSLRKISIIMWRINRIRVRPTHILKLILLQSVFTNLGLLFTLIILISPLAILVVPALVILILGMMALRVATKILARVISGMVNASLIKGMIFLVLIGSFYLLLGVMFLIIATIAKPVVKSTLQILGLLGVITLVAIGTVVLGLLMSLLTPIMVPTLIGLGIVLLAIGILTLMGLMLAVLQQINLDPDKVKENVRTVIDTSLMIIETIFNDDDKDTEESKKSWIASIIDFIGGTLVTIIKAIMAVKFLAIMVVAILLILLIASQLKLIEMIELDKEKINKNVGIVIETAMSVIDSIFNRKDSDSEGTNKSWIESVVSLVAESLLTIIKAIMAVQFLAISVVAILFILLIAGQLRLLEAIKLDKGKINKNVGIVIDTAFSVVDTIFNRKESDSEETKKSWIESVVAFVAEGLLTIIKAILAVQFLAISVVAILFILLIAGQLSLISKIDLDRDKITNNVGIVIDTALSVVDTLFNRKENDSEESKKSWIESVVQFIGGTLVTIIKAIMAVQFLAISIVAILLILVLVNQLKLIQEIELDPEKISTNVNLTITTVQGVVDAITNRKDKETQSSSKSWIRSLLEFVGAGGLLQIIDAIMAMAWLGFGIAIISLVKILAEQLSTIDSIQLSNNIDKKVTDIINSTNVVINAVSNRKDPMSGSGDEKKASFISWLFPRLAEAAEMMSRMRWLSSAVSVIGMIHQLATTLLTLNDLPDISNAKNNAIKTFNNVEEIIRTIENRTAEFDEEEICEKVYGIRKVIKEINRIHDLDPKTLRAAKKSLENNDRFIKQIDNINITKLETASNIFKGISKVSSEINLNFEKMAEVINEELMPVLVELRNTMNDVPEKLEIGFQNTSASISAASVPATTENVEAQIRRENSKDTDEGIINRLVNRRLNDRAKADANGVASKLDELISLLKGYGGNKVIVKTI